MCSSMQRQQKKPICATLIAIEISKASSAVYTWLWGRFESDVRLSATFGCRLEWKIWHKSLFSAESMTSPPHGPLIATLEWEKVINLVNGRFLIATLQSPPRPLENRSLCLERRHKSFEPSKFDKKRKCVTRYQSRFHNFFACLAPQRKFSARQKWKP